MSSYAAQRAFLIAYRNVGTIEGALETTSTPAETHEEWRKDPNYAAAFRAVTKEIKQGKPVSPPKKAPKVPKAPPGKRGRPKRIAAPPAEPVAEPAQFSATLPVAGEDSKPLPEPAAQDEYTNARIHGYREAGSPGEPPPEIAPAVEERVYPSRGGYTKLFVREGQEVAAPPVEPEDTPDRPQDEQSSGPIEVSLPSDADQRRLVDEYGELDRRMQLRAMDSQKYESLKRAIKSWFDGAPADADGYVEGNVYLLHLSARERERKVRSLRELLDLIGIEKFLELAAVSIGALENLLGKAHVASLTVDARTGSRRIKAIPKRAAVAD